MRFWIILVGLGSLAVLGWQWIDEEAPSTWQRRAAVTVSLTHTGQLLGDFATDRETVGGFLAQLGIQPGQHDRLTPPAETPLVPGLRIAYVPARRVTLTVDGRSESIETTAETSADILDEQGIVLDEDDIVQPKRAVVPAAETVLSVTRVEVREEFKDTSIAFGTTVNEDETLSWRTRNVTQKGEKGTKRTTYRVSYHDGKEVNRKTIKSETIKEPVTEIVTQGTYVKLGKKHTGAASWYAWTGTMAAANPWLPKGSYVKVTNVDNGKSVIVVINDRGPFVPGRIIDLDKVAFEKIASLGAGVINVKMEEIIN